MAILALLSGFLVLNFRASGTSANARLQTAYVVIADIRDAQARAIAGTQYEGSSVCGYGVHYSDPMQYVLFARLKTASCPSVPQTYQPGDAIVATKKLVNTRMSISTPFSDIYFELPDPKTYIGGNNGAGLSTTISIIVTSPLSSATVISVSTSGKIDITP